MTHHTFALTNRPARPCSAHDLTFGGRCLNCGYDPAVAPEPPKPTKPAFDFVGTLMAYEEGTAKLPEIMELFSHLIRTGLAWSLQGTYGRTANHLIATGALSRDGEINQNVVERLFYP